MSREEQKRKKKELKDLGDKLVVVLLSGERALVGVQETNCDKPGMILLRDAFPIGMVRIPAMTEDGRPIDNGMGMPQMVNMPQLGTLHWCLFEPITKLYLPEDTARYHVKDQSPESRDAFAGTYMDFREQLRAARAGQVEAEALSGNLVQPAKPGDVANVVRAANALKDPTRG